MFNKNKILTIALYCLLAFFLAASGFLIYQNYPQPKTSPINSIQPENLQKNEKEITAFVKENLGDYYSIAEGGGKEDFGMGSNASLEKTKISRPFPIYVLYPKDIQKIKSDSELFSLLNYSESWYAPINWGDGPGTFIKIRNKNGLWKFSSEGGTGVLKALKQALAIIGKELEPTNQVDSGYDFLFVHVWVHSYPYQIIFFEKNQNLMAISLTAIMHDETPQTQPALSLIQSFLKK